MKRFLLTLLCWVAVAAVAPRVFAADAAPAASTASASSATPASADPEKQKVTNAVAAQEAVKREAAREVHSPGFLEHLVDAVLELFNMRTSGNTLTHYAIAGLLLAAGLLLRRVVTSIVFRQLAKLASKTQTTLDDKLFPALEPAVATFVMLLGLFAGLSVLKLTPDSDRYISYASTFAFSLTIFWGVWRAFGALLDHGHEMATRKGLGIAAFMPWIKKTLMVIFGIIGVLTVIQSLGYGENIKTLLAGLGLGGLAFALAAQDTLANIFGSIVVAIDQPFKIGEFVQIGPHSGAVEDIGLRSTKLRRADKSLIVIPNKTVAAEAVTNLARFTRRRVEQVIGLTYDTKPDQMEAIVNEIREIIRAQPEVDGPGVMVYFRDLNASSLDLWLVYETPNPDFQKSMEVRQRINLLIMRAVEARGLSFAFPTQTVHLAGEIAAKMAERAEPAAPAPRA